MGVIGTGNGSSHPLALDTYVDQVDSTDVARAAMPNDLAAAILAIEAELGINLKGAAVSLVAFLQQEHDTDGTHGVIATLEVSDGVTFAGSGWPRFSAHLSADQTGVASGVSTKVTFDTDSGSYGFDDGGDFNETSNLFFPTEPGKYLLISQVRLNALGAGKKLSVSVYMNNSIEKTSTVYNDSAGTAHAVDATITAIIEFDGSADFADIRIVHDHGSALTVEGTSAEFTYFMGTRVA